jgi:hypothetical protein
MASVRRCQCLLRSLPSLSRFLDILDQRAADGGSAEQRLLMSAGQCRRLSRPQSQQGADAAHRERSAVSVTSTPQDICSSRQGACRRCSHAQGRRRSSPAGQRQRSRSAPPAPCSSACSRSTAPGSAVKDKHAPLCTRTRCQQRGQYPTRALLHHLAGCVISRLSAV